MTVFEADLARRVERIVKGERKTSDLDRLYLALRHRSGSSSSVREVGDFVAHRDEREKGPITQRAKAVITSLDMWLRFSVLGMKPTLDAVKRAGEANLIIATDQQLEERLSLKRTAAKTRFSKAVRALDNGRLPKRQDRIVFDCLGASFLWNPAFDAYDLSHELKEILVRERLFKPGWEGGFADAAPFIALHAVAVMHGAVLRMEDGTRARLSAGYSNLAQNIEVRATLEVRSLGKPVIAPICMFWTTLPAHEHCSKALLADPHAWFAPLEVDEDGRLSPL